MPNKDHYVIIGNGPAGNYAADTLRRNDKDARITIISDEAFAFYYRHKLMDFACGKSDEEALKVRSYNVYKENNIRLRLGQKVEKIDTKNSVLYLKHMEMVGYTKLILATGGAPRILPNLTAYRDHFTFMNTYNDARALQPGIKAAKRVIIFGGDLISINCIRRLKSANREVTFLLLGECFWPFELTSDITKAIINKLDKLEVKALLNPDIRSIARKGKSLVVNMKDNDPVTGDVIFSFQGLTPNIRFIVGSGIDTEQGVLVNEFLQTNINNIYACGDCAQIYNPKLKDYWTSIGWENARIQGETAALNLLGHNKVITQAPKNILHVAGMEIRTQWWKEL